MTRSNAEFQQPLKLYRGLAYTQEPDINSLGSHWTTDLTIAHKFASDDSEMDGEGPAPKGVILEGEVHPEHEVRPGTKEFEGAVDTEGVIGSDNNPEQERYIRPGAPIRITKHHYLEDGQITWHSEQDYDGRA